MSPYIVDFSSSVCVFCGMNSMDTRVFHCPACGTLTCRECVVLLDNGNVCEHRTPSARGVITTQDWDDATQSS